MDWHSEESVNGDFSEQTGKHALEKVIKNFVAIDDSDFCLGNEQNIKV
jgi:hypothetical protein